MQDLIKEFIKRKFFIRIYETTKYYIFWNDINIFKKIPKKQLNNILKTVSIEKFVNESIILINQKINQKYSSNNQKVSVIIPNYNNELFIEKCINSILSNTWENLEVILIDDLSTDNSLEIVKSKFSENPKVHIYQNHTNMGTYYSRNKGIILATGHYILNVDGDDFIEPDMIEMCMNSSNLKKWGYGVNFQRLYVKSDNIDQITTINRSNSFVFLFRRELFNRLGYFQNSRFGADSEYIKRAKFWGYDLEYINLPKIYYNAYTIIGKNLTQSVDYKILAREYIDKCTDILKKNKYIEMALIENLDEMNKIWDYSLKKNKIGIIGLGFVGSAIMQSFTLSGCQVHAAYDKYKNDGIGTPESLLECDIIFSALPTIYRESIQQYDKQPLEETLEFLKNHQYTGIFVCKSTVEPGTSNDLAKKYGIKFIHNPEFLTSRTAFDDFHNQSHIVLGSTSLIQPEDMNKVVKFYKKYYNKAEISISTSEESESMKIFCNCFYSVKIQFFNELFLTCQKNGSDYNKVREMMLKNNWINPMHTNVPGHDGNLSYGGLCFPKDTNALNHYMIRNGIPNKVLTATIEERNEMRKDKDNCA